MENWREILKDWIDRHGYDQRPLSPLAKAHVAVRSRFKAWGLDRLTIMWDTSGSMDMTGFNREADRRRERRDHVDRTIAKWKEGR